MYSGFKGNSPPEKAAQKGFTPYLGQNWDNMVAAGRFAVLKMLIFFSRIFIIS